MDSQVLEAIVYVSCVYKKLHHLGHFKLNLGLACTKG